MSTIPVIDFTSGMIQLSSCIFKNIGCYRLFGSTLFLRIELENRDLRQKQKLKELKNKYLKHSLPGMADKSSQNARRTHQNAPESILRLFVCT